MKTPIFLILLTISVTSQLCDSNQVLFASSCFQACPPNTVSSFKNGITQCEECDITKFFVLNQEKTKCECALQTYFVRQLNQCVPCHYSCLTCSGPLNDQCLTCETDQISTFRIRSGRQCICPPGFYDNAASQQLKCVKCHSDCQTCSGPTQQDCQTCIKGRQKDEFGNCVCQNSFVENQSGQCFCPLQILPDGSCGQIISRCGVNEQNTGGNNKNPIASIRGIALGRKKPGKLNCQCKQGTVRIKGTCGICQQNTVYNPQKHKCQCDSGSVKYNGLCVKCPSNQVFNKNKGKCVCPKTTHMTPQGFCVQCPKKSVYQDGECVCIFNYYFSGNKCKKCTKRGEHPFCADTQVNPDQRKKLEISELTEANNVLIVSSRGKKGSQNIDTTLAPEVQGSKKVKLNT